MLYKKLSNNELYKILTNGVCGKKELQSITTLKKVTLNSYQLNKYYSLVSEINFITGIITPVKREKKQLLLCAPQGDTVRENNINEETTINYKWRYNSKQTAYILVSEYCNNIRLEISSSFSGHMSSSKLFINDKLVMKNLGLKKYEQHILDNLNLSLDLYSARLFNNYDLVKNAN